MTNAHAAHEHILEMSQFMAQCTALNPPVLETYSSSSSLIERRQFTDMIQLANHILLFTRQLGCLHLSVTVFALCNGRRERAFDALVSAANRNPEDYMDTILDGSRIHEAYTCFIPWAMAGSSSSYHDINNPPQLSPRRVSVYKTELKADLVCIGCPSCSFCTKVKRDMLAHETLHWDPRPCNCSQSNQKTLAAGIDTMMQRDVAMPDMQQHLVMNSRDWN
ncbi:hypothetical protein E4T48_06970 [Aureobasidium sp. EXF-10727]|nr:hypothetical protein E4T48_06970 [Aureobasidium sp. EXF-10727]